MKKITESDGAHEAWYGLAKSVNTPDELRQFVTDLCEGYEHDYGTVVHAIAAAAVAAAHCVDHSKQGGITGFQAGAVMWEFITHWNMRSEDLLEIYEHRNLLYPQYDYRYGSISRSTANRLVELAKSELARLPNGYAGPVADRMQQIAGGIFPVRVREES